MIRKIALIAVTVTALTVSGCGGVKQQKDSTPAAPASASPASASPAAPPASASTSPAQPAAAPVELTVKLTDYAFDPKELAIPLAAEVKLTIVNEGKRTHDFEINAYGVKSEVLDAGKQQVVTFKADKAGVFEIICGQKGHKDKGMVGTLTVK